MSSDEENPVTEGAPSGPWAGYTNIKAFMDAVQDALADNAPVILPGYEMVVLPDVLLLELVANGVEVGGHTVLRLDGSSARVAEIPAITLDGVPDV